MGQVQWSAPTGHSIREHLEKRPLKIFVCERRLAEVWQDYRQYDALLTHGAKCQMALMAAAGKAIAGQVAPMAGQAAKLAAAQLVSLGLALPGAIAGVGAAFCFAKFVDSFQKEPTYEKMKQACADALLDYLETKLQAKLKTAMMRLFQEIPLVTNPAGQIAKVDQVVDDLLEVVNHIEVYLDKVKVSEWDPRHMKLFQIFALAALARLVAMGLQRQLGSGKAMVDSGQFHKHVLDKGLQYMQAVSLKSAWIIMYTERPGSLDQNVLLVATDLWPVPKHLRYLQKRFLQIQDSVWHLYAPPLLSMYRHNRQRVCIKMAATATQSDAARFRFLTAHYYYEKDKRDLYSCYLMVHRLDPELRESVRQGEDRMLIKCEVDRLSKIALISGATPGLVQLFVYPQRLSPQSCPWCGGWVHVSRYYKKDHHDRHPDGCYVSVHAHEHNATEFAIETGSSSGTFRLRAVANTDVKGYLCVLPDAGQRNCNSVYVAALTQSSGTEWSFQSDIHSYCFPD